VVNNNGNRGIVATVMVLLMMITMIVDKELNSYMLNMQQNSLIIYIKYIKF